jgi:CBS domain-containing protein
MIGIIFLRLQLPVSVRSSTKTAETASVWSIAPSATVFDAARLMAGQNVGGLMVENGELVGIISERDFPRYSDHPPGEELFMTADTPGGG